MKLALTPCSEIKIRKGEFMAITNKTVTLFPYIDNNIHILCFSGESSGKAITFNLKNGDGSALVLTNTATVNFYWKQEGSASSHYIKGNISNANEGIVSVTLTKALCSVVGKIHSTLEINRAGNSVKFGTIVIDVIDGAGNIDVSNLNTAEYDIILGLQSDVKLLQKQFNDIAVAINSDPNASAYAEIVNARGEYSTLKDKLKATDVSIENLTEVTNFLDKTNHAKDIHLADNWSLYNGIVMTDNGDYVSFAGSSTTSPGQPQTFLLKLDKDLIIDAAKTKFVLAKIRIRAVGADVKITFRDNAFFNSDNTIATNSDSVGSYNNNDTLNNGIWRTIWTVTGGVNKTVSLLGVQPMSATADYELQVSSIDCYYSNDSTTKKINDLKNTISALEGTVDVLNGDTDVTGSVKNQIAVVKSDILQNSVAPLKGSIDTLNSDASTPGSVDYKIKSAKDELVNKINSAVSSVYKIQGSCAFADLPATNADIAKNCEEGYVYNITDEFTTDIRFLEGEGKTYPAGTNIVVVRALTGQVYISFFDVLDGTIDLSHIENTIDTIKTRITLNKVVLFDKNNIPVYISDATSTFGGGGFVSKYPEAKTAFIPSTVTTLRSGTFHSSNVTDVYVDNDYLVDASSAYDPSVTTLHYHGTPEFDSWNALDSIENALLTINSAVEENTVNITANTSATADNTADISSLQDAVDTLNGDSTVSGSVESKIESATSNVYRVKGSCTFAFLKSITSPKVGDVYNITDDFTTTSGFIDGAGKTYPAGTNIVYTKEAMGMPGWDVLAGAGTTYESGTITDYSATYDENSKMNGSYTLMGNLCFVTASAAVKGGWADIDYQLPVAALENTAALSTDGSVSYRVSTDKSSSHLYIHRIEEGSYQNEGNISFTLIYRYK